MLKNDFADLGDRILKSRPFRVFAWTLNGVKIEFCYGRAALCPRSGCKGAKSSNRDSDDHGCRGPASSYQGDLSVPYRDCWVVTLRSRARFRHSLPGPGSRARGPRANVTAWASGPARARDPGQAVTNSSGSVDET